MVVGYFQQGDELKQSTAALRLQGEELKNSVEQQHKLAEISRQALEHEKEVRQNEVHRRARSLRPVLSLKGGSPMMENGEYVLDCELINHGSQVYDIQVILRVGNTKSLVGCASVMNDGDTIRFSVNWDPRRSGGKLDVEILYENRDGVHAATTFTAISSGNFGALDFIKVASLNE
ncbi:hypothetical protein D3C76_1335370 [compost metagenome]